MVVLDHFYNKKKKAKFTHILYYHIPTFFLLSFYYNYKTFANFDITKIKLRFERLIIPYISWSIISYILYNIYYYYFKKECPHTISNFLENLLNGHIFILALWFQNILIFTTLIVSIIVLCFKNQYISIFQILFILAYIFQYSGENFRFFIHHFSLFYYATYGRFIETFPNSITGFFIAAFRITHSLRIYKYRTIIISSAILFCVSRYRFDNNLLSFKYGGIRLNIASICIFFIFFYLPFDKIKNKKLKNSLINLYITVENVFGCLIIYIISFIICFLLDKLLINKRLKHLIK